MIKGVEFLYSVSDIQKLQIFLDQNKNLDIAELRDDKKNSVLHNAAFGNHLQIVKIFLEHIKKVYDGEYWNNNSVYKKPVKQAIQAFVNDGNSQGFTCLHYAAYRGNMEMIKLFTVMHSAAQNNQLVSLLFFFLFFFFFLSFNIADKRKSTLLHEASKTGS